MSCHKPKRTDKEKYIGIEIEFYSPYTKGYVEKMFEKNKVLKSFCKLGGDGSISSEYDNEGFELRILSKLKDLKSNLNIVKNFLSVVQAEVNKSCGLHVHLDARNNNAQLMLKNLTRNIKEIENSVPKYRLDNDYSNSIQRRQNITNMLEMIKHYQEGNRNSYTTINPYTGYTEWKQRVPNYNGGKYQSINIEPMLSYKTIEVRCHEGTVNCAEIYKWCKYLSEVAYEETVSRTSKTYVEK